jgi:hypothetical protein
VRSLGQPAVLKAAVVAALGTAAASYPRFLVAPRLRYEVWYLLTLLFLGAIVLWAFVFAWHAQYSGRPVFALSPPRRVVGLATAAGLGCGLLLHFFLDPAMRSRTPADYPQTVGQWLAMVMFSLAFVQLFLVFAPFAWLVRLFRHVPTATLLTVLFGVFVLAVKNRSPETPMPLLLMLGLLVFRIAGGLFSVYFYLRGGVLVVWWWALLVQSRHLIRLALEH